MQNPQFDVTTVAPLVSALREIAWSDDRVPGDETGERADLALRAFAARHPDAMHLFEFQELREYLEAQGDLAAT